MCVYMWVTEWLQKGLKILKHEEMQRWLSCKDHIALFQLARVQLLAIWITHNLFYLQLQEILCLWLPQALTHMWHTHTHTIKNKINPKQ